MKSLVTGAGGWLGSELVKKLLIDGKRVRAFTLRNSIKLNELKEEYNDQLEIINGDICNENQLSEAIRGISVVYHLAAKVHTVPKSKIEENEFFRVNSEASKKLFEMCIEEKVNRVIFYSSVSVYGKHEGQINIETEKKPITAYAKSKMEAEKIAINLFKEQGLPITIIEPVTVYGGKDKGNFEKMNRLSKKRILIRFGDGENKKTIIHFKDLIRISILIAEDYETIGDIIICGSEEISINNINQVFYENIKGKKIKVYINKYISSCIKKIFGKNKKLQNISRIIDVLMSNNMYDTSRIKQISNKYNLKLIDFKSYYQIEEDKDGKA